jgi:serine/threonine protein phosphatase PrpC
MAARCEAAGRHYNEDNFQLTDDLSSGQWGFVTGKETELGKNGILMAVCDGMGGMNAGATASRLAVRSVREWFAADRLTPQVTACDATIMMYIQQAIIVADEKIKETGRQNKACEGMGSTIVLTWIIGNTAYVGWCGDSRAYRFNPATGLERLSRDHSYVQELVDSGKLSQELAFDHPDTNIITRSLGDTRRTACPDVTSHPLRNGDIILLCSDGLSGVLRDTEIETVMANHSDTLENCRNALWTESEKAGWTDNVTIALCQIVSGAGSVGAFRLRSMTGEVGEIGEMGKVGEMGEIVGETVKPAPKRRIWKTLWIAILILLLAAIAFEVWHFYNTGSWWLPDLRVIRHFKR